VELHGVIVNDSLAFARFVMATHAHCCDDRRVRAHLVIAVLAACGAEPRPPMSNAGGGKVAVIPEGWMAIELDDERRHCANYAEDEWQVAIDHGTVKLAQANPPDADTGPPLPFTPAQPTQPRGRQHVVAVADGFLVGFDAGEWGGSLSWFSKDGARSTKLADDNVRGLVVMGPDLVASIEGLSHMGISEGNVRWIEHAGTWKAGALTALPLAPRAFVADATGLYVLTSENLLHVGKDRRVAVIQPIDTASLYPDSMAFDDDGVLWIGMRQLVLRLTPNGPAFTQTWLVRESCARATVKDLSCICEPLERH
jgi:hypothetical protein